MADPIPTTDAANVNGQPAAKKPYVPAWERGEEDTLYIGPFHKAVRQDHFWAMNQINAGAWEQYRGKYVAVVEEKIVGVGDSPVDMERELSERLGVIPARLAIIYVDPDPSRWWHV